MKVYLLNAPYKPRFTRDMRWQDTGRSGTLYYPIWLAYATGILEQAGATVRLVDTAASKLSMEQVLLDIDVFHPDLVVVDTSFPSLDYDISVAEAIKKKFPYVKTAMVGAPASQFADKMLSNPGIDIVCRWEFDFVLKDLVKMMETRGDLRGVNGISYKNGDAVVHNSDRPPSTSAELDNIPFVSAVYQKHLNINDYMLTYSYSMHPEVQIFTGRGCPFQCTFCSWPQTLMGRKYRARSTANILDEFEYIEKNLPHVKQIFLEDDTFTINDQQVIDFCRGYQERRLKITWGAQGRVGMGYSIMKTMKEANCLMIDVGYESGSNAILKNVKKGISVEQMEPFAREAKRAGLSIHGNWIIGLQGETRETIAETKRMIKKTGADAITVAVVTPFPGTELYRWAKEKGYLVTDDPNEYLDERGHQKAIISYPELSSDEIRETVDSILKSYYLSFSYVPIAFKRVFGRHGWNNLKVLGRSGIAFVRYISSQ